MKLNADGIRKMHWQEHGEWVADAHWRRTAHPDRLRRQPLSQGREGRGHLIFFAKHPTHSEPWPHGYEFLPSGARNLKRSEALKVNAEHDTEVCMRIIAAMFDSRTHAEDAIDRLIASGCPRDAVTFLPEQELTEVATGGAYDWRQDRWGLWRGLAAFEVVTDPDRYCFAEGMNRGGSVLLVASKNDELAERYGTILVEAGAVDLDEREQVWREAGWTGFDGNGNKPLSPRRSGPSPKLRTF